jgi:hypothetical protein
MEPKDEEEIKIKITKIIIGINTEAIINKYENS